MSTLFLLLLFFVLLGILSILVALPLLEEKVKPNIFYGFRVRATLENPKVWYAANKYFAQRLLLAGGIEIIAAFALYFIPYLSVEAYVGGVLVVFAVAFTIGMIQSFNYLKSLPRESNDSPEHPV